MVVSVIVSIWATLKKSGLIWLIDWLIDWKMLLTCIILSVAVVTCLFFCSYYYYYEFFWYAVLPMMLSVCHLWLLYLQFRKCVCVDAWSDQLWLSTEASVGRKHSGTIICVWYRRSTGTESCNELVVVLNFVKGLLCLHTCNYTSWCRMLCSVHGYVRNFCFF